MKSRNKILAAIRANKPEALNPVDEWETIPVDKEKRAVEFAENAAKAGIVLHNSKQLKMDSVALVNKLYPPEKYSYNERGGQFGKATVLCRTAQFGVAENAACYFELDDEDRVSLFSPTHFVAILKSDALVSNMHEAYKKASISKGFSCFVAGPSKTADIEQSLVIGAQGPASMDIIIT